AKNKDPTLPDPLQRVARYDSLRYATVYGGALLAINGKSARFQGGGGPVDYVYTYDEAFAQANRYQFDSLLPRYHSAREAYEAVLNDPSLVIVSVGYNFDEQGQPGPYKAGD